MVAGAGDEKNAGATFSVSVLAPALGGRRCATGLARGKCTPADVLHAVGAPAGSGATLLFRGARLPPDDPAALNGVPDGATLMLGSAGVPVSAAREREVIEAEAERRAARAERTGDETPEDEPLVGASASSLRNRAPRNACVALLVGAADDEHADSRFLCWPAWAMALAVPQRLRGRAYSFLRVTLCLPEALCYVLLSVRPAVWASLIAWLVALRGSAAVGVPELFVMGSIVTGIACNLGVRRAGEVSAYSIFNDDFRELPGAFNAEAVDNMLRRRM